MVCRVAQEGELHHGSTQDSGNKRIELIHLQVPPPELLLRDRTNVAALPYNLFDRVLAAANEGDEKDDKRVQAKVAVLRQAIERRVTGLRKLEGR